MWPTYLLNKQDSQAPDNHERSHRDEKIFIFWIIIVTHYRFDNIIFKGIFFFSNITF